MASSTQSFRDRFEQALLSLASYGTSLTDNTALEAAVSQKTGSAAAGQYVRDRFDVVTQSPEGSSSGYSGTLFRRQGALQGPADGAYTYAIRGTESDVRDLLLADILGIASLGNAGQQVLDAKAHLGALVTQHSLGANNLSVTGHSLGGHLAMMIATDTALSEKVGHVYTYNGAGIHDEAQGPSDPRFAAAMSLLREALGARTSIPSSLVSNFIGTAGLDVISGVNTLVGSVDRVFTEEGGLADVREHSIGNIAVGNACYYLLSLMDPNVASNPSAAAAIYRVVLESGSEESTLSFESFARSLQKVFGLSGSVGVDGQDAIFALIRNFEVPSLQSGYRAPGTLVNIAGKTASDVITMAANETTQNGSYGRAVRFALQEGLPFAFVWPQNPGHPESTNPYDTSAYDLENFSPEYLFDRANYLEGLFARNIADDLIPFSMARGVEYVDTAALSMGRCNTLA